MAAKADFSTKLGKLSEGRQQVQAEMREAHGELQRQIRELQAQRQEISSARATKGEIVAVAEKSIRTQAENFERRQREHGLGQMVASTAAKLMRPPRTEGLEGPQNMQLREGVAREHNRSLFGALFMANETPRESDKLNAATMAQFVSWCFGDQILERVKEFADGLEDAPDGVVREAEISRIDAEVERLQGEAAQIRREASEAGLHLEAA